MYVKDFMVVSVIITGELKGIYPCNDGTGHILLAKSEEQSQWVYVDHPPTWDTVASLEEGTHLTAHATVKLGEGDGGNDLYVIRSLDLVRPFCTIAGYIANPQIKTTSKGKMMSFAIYNSHDVDGQKVRQFFQCECWTEFLFKQIKKGTFVSASGSAEMSYFEDKNGEQRSKFTLKVHNMASPPPSALSQKAPSKTPPMTATSMTPPVKTKTTTVGAAPLETDGVEF